MSEFSLDNISSQKGKIAIVTGANIGLGYHTVIGLAKVGFKVIMASRSKEKVENAKLKILKILPEADLEIILLDLNSLANIRKFVSTFLNQYNQLDLLVNNAGLMMPPYQLTEDGFESQIGINHLGHFLLTGLLLNTMNQSAGSRVVSLSSIAHKKGNIQFDDFHFKKNYNAQKAYSQSKLACLMFAYELQKRLEKNHYQVLSVAAHPGVAITNLAQYLPKLMVNIGMTLGKPFLQSAEQGAEPSLRAALDPKVKGGEYFGPSGFGEIKGSAVRVGSSPISKEEEIAKKLWELSEREVGLMYL